MANLTTCRLCSEERAIYLTPLCENATEEMLRDLTAMKIVRSDKIPSYICSECLYDLKIAYKIQQRMVEVETKYQDKIVTDFLLENHDQLGEITQQEQNKSVGDATDENIEEASPTNAEDIPVKHKCQICSCKFQFSPDYVKHLQEHIVGNNKSPKCDILCEQCGLIFTDPQLHEGHMSETHSTYPSSNDCFYCSETFATTLSLEDHVKEIHTNKKPYICNICNERFAVRYILNLHKAQHNIVKPFACEICGQKFKQKLSLRAHHRLRHREEVAPEVTMNARRN